MTLLQGMPEEEEQAQFYNQEPKGNKTGEEC